MVKQDEIFSFKIKSQANKVFPSDVERTANDGSIPPQSVSDGWHLTNNVCDRAHRDPVHYENTPIQIY